MGRQSRFPGKFRRQAVRFVITTDRPVLQVAKETRVRSLRQVNEARRGSGDRAGALNEPDGDGLRWYERSDLDSLKADHDAQI
jgi:transposase-like protein